MKRSKHGLFVSLPIVLQYDVKAKYRLISRKFSGMKFFHLSVRLTNQKPHAFVSVQQNQSNRTIFVRLLFLFCLRVFIWRSYENRSIKDWKDTLQYPRHNTQANQQWFAQHQETFAFWRRPSPLPWSGKSISFRCLKHLEPAKVGEESWNYAFRLPRDFMKPTLSSGQKYSVADQICYPPYYVKSTNVPKNVKC